MMTFQGIAVDSWVTYVEDCHLSCEVTGEQVQLCFGHNTGSLNLVTSEAGLRKLAVIAAEALTTLDRAAPDTLVDFRVQVVDHSGE